EALQQLYRLCSDLNSQSVWFFPMLKKSAEGHILYEKSEKHAYVYNLITQNQFPSFLTWITALNNKRFFKSKKSALATVFLKPNCDEPSIGQIIKGQNYTPYFKNTEFITLFSIKNILTTMLYNDIDLMSVTLTEGKEFLCLVLLSTNIKKELYIRKAFNESQEPFKCSIFVSGLKGSIPEFKQAAYLQGDHLYSNFLEPPNDHEIIANLENKGFENKAYCKADCTLLELIEDLCDRLKTKFEAEEEQASELLTSIVHNIVDEVLDKKHENISNIILKNRSPAAYKAIKSVIRMPLLSTLKNYISEADQHTGLLWSQRDNKYVSYINFDDENVEFEAFGKQCLYNVQGLEYMSKHNKRNNNNEKEYEQTLATQVHQIVWHSISHSFNFSIAYFGVETINVHTFNMTLFHLAAKLECVAIHTYGSICNGASENRRHIKSFNWFATI
ncbi:12720_t:CDS:2, partial [Cetraspora pellucida]